LLTTFITKFISSMKSLGNDLVFGTACPPPNGWCRKYHVSFQLFH